MGYSNTALANQALDHIGSANIASLTEASTNARRVNAAFERTIHSALTRSPWTFNRKIAQLAEVTNDWAERWEHAYDVPTDAAKFVRVISTVDDIDATPPRHEMKQGKVYTNVDAAKGEYVYNTTATLDMPVFFLDAVSFLLARNICMPLTRKRSLWNDLNQQYELTLGLAIQTDAGQELNTYNNGDGGYLGARGASSSNEGASVDGSEYWS